MQVAIVGAVLPLLLSLAKRWNMKLDGATVGLVTIFICFLVAVVTMLVTGKFDYQDIPGAFIIAYGMSQVIYKGIMKPIGLDERIESK